MNVAVRPAARFSQQFVGKLPFVWRRVRSDEAAKGLADLEGQSVSERQAINGDAVKTDFLTVRAEIDATHPSDNDERINVGAEANFLGRFFLRGGYRFRYDDETFTFGGGLTFPFGDNIIRFDYAFANFTLLPDLHRYTIAFDF